MDKKFQRSATSGMESIEKTFLKFLSVISNEFSVKHSTKNISDSNKKNKRRKIIYY